MASRPPAVREVFSEWADEFSETIWPRFQLLVFAAIVCVGRHTVCRLLRIAGALAEGHWSSYHHVLSKRRWSTWRLARILAEHVVDRFVPRGTIAISGDDTVTQHRGKQVYGKGRYRDAVRSTHSYTAWRWGHKWVVLAVHVQLPGTNRPWALPVLCALYRSPEENKRPGRRHKTPCDLMRQLLCVLLRWFPRRKFLFAGDGGYGTHALARFASRQPRLTLVSKFYKDANLHDLPPQRKPGANGRPPVKGRKRSAPETVVAKTKRRHRLSVVWYGGGRRQVAAVTGTGHWYKGGEGLVPVRWVFVEDLTGTPRDEDFFTTDVALTPKQIIEAYTGRWAIEVTFEEVREPVGLESTRGRCARTVLRAEPGLFGWYTLVALWCPGSA
jgi:DDE superfamily endonuclease